MNTQETELRDQFAMTALKGILSSPDYPRWNDYEAIAKDCYNIAEAMKIERAKSQPAPDRLDAENIDELLDAVRVILHNWDEGPQDADVHRSMSDLRKVYDKFCH